MNEVVNKIDIPYLSEVVNKTDIPYLSEVVNKIDVPCLSEVENKIDIPYLSEVVNPQDTEKMTCQIDRFLFITSCTVKQERSLELGREVGS